MIKKLDGYIIKKFLGTFFFTILLFSLIIVVIDVSERVDDFLEKEAPLKLIVTDYYLNFIPHIIFLLCPLFIFISLIFFTSRLAYRSEIVAILASGVSFYRLLLVPYFLSAAFLVALQLYANHYWVPNANKDRIIFENEYIRGTYINSARNIHLQIDPETFIYLESFNNRDNSGRRFTMEKIKDKKMYYKLEAPRIKYDEKKEKWSMNKYMVRTINGLNEKIKEGEKLDTALNLLPQDFDQRTNFKEAMPTPELNRFIEKEIMKGSPNVEFYLVEKHRRTAIPFATFILAIIGLSIASRKVRGGMGLHIFWGIAISAAYVLFLQFSQTFATNGNLSPLLSVWVPNFIFGVLSIYLLWKAPK